MKNRVVGVCAIYLFGLSSCSIVRYNVPNVTDFKIFNTEFIDKANQPIYLTKSSTNGALPDEFLWTVSEKENTYYEFATPEQFLESSGTNSLIVIRNDSILYENYFNGYKADSIQTIFSITKAFSAAMVGIAIQEGAIKSVNQLVSDFIPEYKENGRDKMTINHLLQMTSGVAEKDFRDIVKLGRFYYAKNQTKQCVNLKMRYEPGTEFQYSSMTTQILGICLEKATGKTFAEYLQEKIWQPLGMQHNAKIAIDKAGTAKYFGGLAMTPIDLAKFGLLYLNNGVWNGKQIIPAEWVKATATRDTTAGRSIAYSHCFWLDTYPLENRFNRNDFFAGGFLGQIVYVNPDNNTVIIRTGSKEGNIHWGRSISKLSHFPIQKLNVLTEERIASLDGSYKNQFGNEIKLSLRGGKVILRDKDEDIELERSSDVTFFDKKSGRKMLVEFKRNEIKGLIVEADNKSYFFRKN